MLSLAGNIFWTERHSIGADQSTARAYKRDSKRADWLYVDNKNQFLSREDESIDDTPIERIYTRARSAEESSDTIHAASEDIYKGLLLSVKLCIST